jgi:phosphatidylglycerol:prolipoprotein diacylglycerol transferase
MAAMVIPFPNIDPVAISLGPLHVKWYGIAYLAGLTLGWLYMRRLARDERLWGGDSPLKLEQADDFLLWATLGVVVGGRLGFVLLYEPSVFLSQPWRLFSVWEGGMAFHGGVIGVVTAIVLFARLNGIPVLSMGDITCAVVPIGLFFGRIANFINGEIYGRLTDAPWAVEFPARVLSPEHLPGPRHPTQIYEAALEGVMLFLVLRWVTHSRLGFTRPGLTAGVFLAGYALARIAVEFFKEWDYAQFFTSAYFSEGMIYSLPMLVFGLYLIMNALRRPSPSLRGA